MKFLILVMNKISMRLLADFVREIIGKLVKWFKTTGKNIKTLLESLKEAIKSFVGKLKTHLFNAADTLLTTIATEIIEGAKAAVAGADSTKEIVARMGRAGTVGERSIGYPDAGAYALGVIFTELTDSLNFKK